MKRLILVRHGKSSWKEDVPDDERPLKKRAFKDADLVIKAFQSFRENKPVMWSSYAKRAFTTAKIFKEELQIEDERFTVRNDLYTFSKKELLKIITSADDSIEVLMLFGHNPAMTGVANSLGDQDFDNVPTTGMVVIDFKAEHWRDLQNGKTILYLFPKHLK